MTEKNRKKKSQLPYEVSTSSIGEIMNAKASNGDKKAIKAAKYFSVKEQ